MSRTTKILLIILIPILIVLGLLFILIDAVYVQKPDPVVFPQGELTESIFTEQNNNYTKNESLPEKHVFTTIPYTVDITEGDGAQVGSGIIYKVDNSDKFFIYATEYDDSTNAQDIIASQFPAVMLINYVPELTKVTVQVNKKGFINGFSAEYIAETITASNGTVTNEAAIIGYALDVPGVEYAGKHIFVGLGTTEVNTDNLSICAQVLSTVMQTVTKDEKLEEDRRKEREQASLLEQQEALKSIETTEQEQSEVQTQQSVPQVATIPIPVEKEYGNLKVTVEWDNSNPDAVLELFNPEKTTYYDPSYQNDFGAGFVIPNGEMGDYELHIANAAACGSIMTSHSGAEVEDAGNIDETPEEVVEEVVEDIEEAAE